MPLQVRVAPIRWLPDRREERRRTRSCKRASKPRSLVDQVHSLTYDDCEGNAIVSSPAQSDAETSLSQSGDKRKRSEVELPAGTEPVPEEPWRNLLADGLIGAMPLRTHHHFHHPDILAQPTILPVIFGPPIHHPDHRSARRAAEARQHRLVAGAVRSTRCVRRSLPT